MPAFGSGAAVAGVERAVGRRPVGAKSQGRGVGPGRALVLGLGNLLLGDEGAGVYAAAKLRQAPLPRGVAVLDGGTSGFGLLAYLGGWERVFVVDAILGGGRPGWIYRLRPADLAPRPGGLSLHEVDVAWLLYLYRPDAVIYAIEIGENVPREPRLGLTPPVAAAVDAVVAHIRAELECE